MADKNIRPDWSPEKLDLIDPDLIDVYISLRDKPYILVERPS